MRLHLSNSSYGDFETVKARLLELGVRHIGDGLCPTCEHQIDRLKRLAALGIRANLGLGNQNDSAVMQQGLQVIRNRLRDAVVSVTGPNEPDISGDPQWIAHTRAYQAELYPGEGRPGPPAPPGDRAEPRLPPRAAALGDLSAHLDEGNIHPYPAGVLPMADLALEHQLAAHVAGNKPLVATEVGYHNDISFTGIHGGHQSEPARPTRPGWSSRASGTASRGPICSSSPTRGAPPRRRLGASPAQATRSDCCAGTFREGLPSSHSATSCERSRRARPRWPPGGLRYGLEGAGPDVRQLLLRAADGSYALVLWRQVSVWDRDALRDLSPTTQRLVWCSASRWRSPSASTR